jgi:hypothetical protein
MSITKQAIADVINQYDSLCLDSPEDREVLIDHLYANLSDSPQEGEK